MQIIAQDPPINLFDAVKAYREKQMAIESENEFTEAFFRLETHGGGTLGWEQWTADEKVKILITNSDGCGEALEGPDDYFIVGAYSLETGDSVMDDEVEEGGTTPAEAIEKATEIANRFGGFWIMDFTTPLLTLEQGKKFIESLVAADMLFHFEDSPETIIRGATGEPLFTKAQAKDVRARVGELYSMDWTVTGHECPIGYALEADQPDVYAPTIARMEEEYGSFLTVHHLPEASAEELLMTHDLTDHQRTWLTTFCERWKAVQAREDAAH